MRLLGSLVNARNLPRHGASEVVRLAREIPAYSLSYSGFEQLGASLIQAFEIQAFDIQAFNVSVADEDSEFA